MAQNGRLSLAQRTRATVAQRTGKGVIGDENAAPKSVLAGPAGRVALGPKQADAKAGAGLPKAASRRAALHDLSNKEKVTRIVDEGKKEKENKEPAATTTTRPRSSTLNGVAKRVALRPVSAPVSDATISTRRGRSSSASSDISSQASDATVRAPIVFIDSVEVVVEEEEYIEERDTSDVESEMETDTMDVDDEVVPTAGIVTSSSNPASLDAIATSAPTSAATPPRTIASSESDEVARQLSPSPVEEEQDSDDEEGEDITMEDWVTLPSREWAKVQSELDRVRKTVEDEVNPYDMTMVAEYAEEILEYMGELEASVMPSPTYMTSQTELAWSMRTTLVDWLLQVHLRYHMLPETLWIAVNIVDRFLSARVVSLVKLQLVGVTAMFIAAKYEEILAPSVEEFVFMTENGYNKEEILKGERIILQTLDFKVSNYCSPYTWVRRISKADDYDIHTRTLCKFLMEMTLLDERFLRARPSMIAAIGMYVARRMLGGDWGDQFIFYSCYTEAQILPGAKFIVERLCAPECEDYYVCKKYANKRFLKASVFAREWAKKHGGEVAQEGLIGLGFTNVKTTGSIANGVPPSA